MKYWLELPVFYLKASTEKKKVYYKVKNNLQDEQCNSIIVMFLKKFSEKFSEVIFTNDF